jgi:hypothetical protein
MRARTDRIFIVDDHTPALGHAVDQARPLPTSGEIHAPDRACDVPVRAPIQRVIVRHARRWFG